MPSGPIQQFHACGGNNADALRASAVGAVDLKSIIEPTSSNPLLALRRSAFHTGAVQTMPSRLQHPAAITPVLKPSDAAPGLPVSVDWRDRFGGRWLASVQNQNRCGNCWAFAAAALVETMTRIEHALWAKRSEGDIRDGWSATWSPPPADICTHGAGVQDALAWVTASGVADPECYAYVDQDRPYTPTGDRSGRTVTIPAVQALGDVTAQKRWLDAVGPLAAPIDAWQSFKHHGAGVWKRDPTVDVAGPDNGTPPTTWPQGHVVLVVGYDDGQGCWIIRNSWGTGWGVAGYGLIAYGEASIDIYAKYGVQNTNPDPWSRRRLHNGCLLESGNGAGHRNFEVLLSTFVTTSHYWREGGAGGDFSWTKGEAVASPPEPGAFAGNPTFISTTFGRNFEAVQLNPAGSGHPIALRHRFFDQGRRIWIDGGRFGPPDADGFPGFIQSSYGAPGNFEVVFRTSDGRLCHWWREGQAPWSWKEAERFGANVLQSGPSLIQSHAGTGTSPGDFVAGKPGNFELVAVLTDGTMQHWWRDNALPSPVWKPGAVFGSGIPNTPICMIEGGWGTTDETSLGNFELCVSTGFKVQHWWLDNGGDRKWRMSAEFGSRVAHVWGMVQSSWGNLDIIVETVDLGHQHYWRDGAGWHEGPMLPI